jgi:hypothetical protein
VGAGWLGNVAGGAGVGTIRSVVGIAVGSAVEATVGTAELAVGSATLAAGSAGSGAGCSDDTGATTPCLAARVIGGAPVGGGGVGSSNTAGSARAGADAGIWVAISGKGVAVAGTTVRITVVEAEGVASVAGAASTAGASASCVAPIDMVPAKSNSAIGTSAAPHNECGRS